MLETPDSVLGILNHPAPTAGLHSFSPAIDRMAGSD